MKPIACIAYIYTHPHLVLLFLIRFAYARVTRFTAPFPFLHIFYSLAMHFKTFQQRHVHFGRQFGTNASSLVHPYLRMRLQHSSTYKPINVGHIFRIGQKIMQISKLGCTRDVIEFMNSKMVCTLRVRHMRLKYS